VGVGVGFGGGRAHQRHVVERRDEDAPVDHVKVHVLVELGVGGGMGLASGARRVGAEPVLGAGA
jgi:hypothetical protein